MPFPCWGQSFIHPLLHCPRSPYPARRPSSPSGHFTMSGYEWPRLHATPKITRLLLFGSDTFPSVFTLLDLTDLGVEGGGVGVCGHKFLSPHSASFFCSLNKICPRGRCQRGGVCGWLVVVGWLDTRKVGWSLAKVVGRAEWLDWCVCVCYVPVYVLDHWVGIRVVLGIVLRVIRRLL